MVPSIIKNKNTKIVNKFDKIGSDIGLLFQIKDDLIDYSESSSEKDSSLCNMRRFMSEAEIREYCISLANKCTNNSKLFGSKDNSLNKLIYSLASRTS